MPPPIPAHMKRLTANPAKPARYRPGKPTHTEEESDEEEDLEEETQVIEQPKRTKQQQKPRVPQVAPVIASEDDDEEGFVTDEEDDNDGGAEVVAKYVSKPSTATAGVSSTGLGHQTAARQTASSEDESEEESGSEEDSEEETSEDEAPQRKFLRPTFIMKSDRKTATPAPIVQDTTPAPEISSTQQSEEVAARRLAEAEMLIKTTIERDTAARLAGKKSWDDDDDLPPEALVDDTDNLDPEAEKSAWRLRELHRLKRDREVIIAREKELEEIERRRNLTAEERDAEDQAYIAKQREEKESTRGQATFLSKYHHKGAFFMDDEDSARLAKRDLIGAKFADDVDKSSLPEYMQIRDMTKLGKKGRTRYTDLKGQDTGHFGEDVKRWRGSGYTNTHGHRDSPLASVDERFLPDDERRLGPQTTGANTSALGERRKRERTRSRSPRAHHGRSRNRDSYRSRSRSRERRRNSPGISRSRSRSPKRRHSPYHERDKRRRLET